MAALPTEKNPKNCGILELQMQSHTGGWLNTKSQQGRHT